MRTNAFLISVSLLLTLLPGCADTPARPAPAAADPHGRAVDGLVGVWAGNAVGTPMGDFPFAVAFDREADGDVRGRLDDGRGMYLDFRFHRDGARWLLMEEGQIPSIGKQARTLAPVEGGGAPRWLDGEARVAVELAVDDATLVMTTTLGGERHAQFRLQRVRGGAAERIRPAIARGPRPAAE
jgi:hypothetical protein